jgi:hypothetical protein
MLLALFVCNFVGRRRVSFERWLDDTADPVSRFRVLYGLRELLL